MQGVLLSAGLAARSVPNTKLGMRSSRDHQWPQMTFQSSSLAGRHQLPLTALVDSERPMRSDPWTVSVCIWGPDCCSAMELRRWSRTT